MVYMPNVRCPAMHLGRDTCAGGDLADCRVSCAGWVSREEGSGCALVVAHLAGPVYVTVCTVLYVLHISGSGPNQHSLLLVPGQELYLMTYTRQVGALWGERWWLGGVSRCIVYAKAGRHHCSLQTGQVPGCDAVMPAGHTHQLNGKVVHQTRGTISRAKRPGKAHRWW